MRAGAARYPSGPDDPWQVELALALSRLHGMVGELLVEQRRGPLDEPARERLRSIYLRSVAEARLHLPADESAELARLAQAFDRDNPPSDVELRLANGQLIGWIEGCFTGVELECALAEAASMRPLVSGPAGVAVPVLPGPRSLTGLSGAR